MIGAVGNSPSSHANKQMEMEKSDVNATVIVCVPVSLAFLKFSRVENAPWVLYH